MPTAPQVNGVVTDRGTCYLVRDRKTRQKELLGGAFFFVAT